MSASKAGLLRECQYWARDEVPWYSPSSKAAEDGIDGHTRLEVEACDVLMGKHPPHSGAVRWLFDHVVNRYAHAEEGDGSAGNAGDGGSLVIEGALALDLETATACNIVVSGRDYPPDMLCGRADAIVVHEDEVIVVDWKFGQVRDYHHDQCQLLGSMAASAFGVSRALYVLGYVERDLMLRFEPVFHPVADPQSVLSEFASLASQIKSAGTWPGVHCVTHYCPHAAYCKEGDKVTRMAIDDKLEVNDLNAADMYTLLGLLKKRHERAESQLKQIARDRGQLELGDGRVYRERTRKSRRLNTKLAEQMAREAGVPENELFNEKEYKAFEVTKAGK